MPHNVIWTPDAPARPREEISSDEGEAYALFSEIANRHHVGVHCRRCLQPLVGKNDWTDAVFAQTCGCREMVWRNNRQRVNES